jgi:hypothetical protein
LYRVSFGMQVQPSQKEDQGERLHGDVLSTEHAGTRVVTCKDCTTTRCACLRHRMHASEAVTSSTAERMRGSPKLKSQDGYHCYSYRRKRHVKVNSGQAGYRWHSGDAEFQACVALYGLQQQCSCCQTVFSILHTMRMLDFH